MGFLGVYRAIYDYTPQAEGELAFADGDLLYILDKQGDDGWWRAKKKASADEEDEPTGLVPNNYVDEAKPLGHARTLYDYTRQTDEELSFSEDAQLDVLDASDPDWILVGLDGECGFVPSNYIDMDDDLEASGPPAPPTPPAAPALPTRPPAPPMPDTQPDSPVEAANPAAALAGVMQARSSSQPEQPPSQPVRKTVRYAIPDEEEEEEEPVRSPALPTRPRPTSTYPTSPTSPTYQEQISSRQVHLPPPDDDEIPRTPDNFHMYNINEMISIMGKKKKMPTTLGINLRTGIILIAPEHPSDGPSVEWTADRMTHYSREGKHVFMELVRPSKSVDFHAGAKDTAEEIVNALGELAGAVRAEGLREVIMAGTGQKQKKGQVLYDFMAQGDDEVTVAVGDEVIIIDDSKSEEWWQVRRLKNNKEGVVPSSYIEITGTTSPASSGLNPARAIVEQNRLDEIRMTKEAIKAGKEPQQQRSQRDNRRSDGGSSKPKAKPDSSKVRAWTDRSKSFSVEAQFLGLKDGKIHLHKMNGVKIAVPITKMSKEDLEYVENLTGISLDDERPLADVKKARSAAAGKTEKKASSPDVGVSIDKSKSDYDWFQFFLSCEVAVGLCERYAQAFIKDSMDESVLPDVDASILRALGIREGDIIKVMRTLDVKYGRGRNGKRNSEGGDGEGSGGLFSGPGGTLRNNTRKGRPAPAVQTSDVVDAKAFSKADSSSPGALDDARSPTQSSPVKTTPQAQQPMSSGGFDDDAWDVKPTKQTPTAQPKPQSPQQSTSPAPAPVPAAPPAPQAPALTGSMQELSLLTAPLEPARTEPAPQPEPAAPASAGAVPPPAQQMPGASPAFFTGVSQSQQTPQAIARQRPTPPQAMIGQSSLVPPPPQRPLSAPQSAQVSAFSPPPMMPQMTGALQGQPAAPGQSLNEMTQARLQQQYNMQQFQQPQQQMPQLQPNMTGFGGQNVGMMGYPTGNNLNGGFMQPMMTGAQIPANQMPNQFTGMQPQPTGFQSPFAGGPSPFGQAPAAGGVNNYLPPALEPQRTGFTGIQPQATGLGGMNQMNTMNTNPPPMQPLQPQPTGPAPPVRFGVNPEAKKLAPQATGRRANLSQATPQNPFGF